MAKYIRRQIVHVRDLFHSSDKRKVLNISLEERQQPRRPSSLFNKDKFSDKANNNSPHSSRPTTPTPSAQASDSKTALRPPCQPSEASNSQTVQRPARHSAPAPPPPPALPLPSPPSSQPQAPPRRRRRTRRDSAETWVSTPTSPHSVSSPTSPHPLQLHDSDSSAKPLSSPTSELPPGRGQVASPAGRGQIVNPAGVSTANFTAERDLSREPEPVSSARLPPRLPDHEASRPENLNVSVDWLNQSHVSSYSYSRSVDPSSDRDSVVNNANNQLAGKRYLKKGQAPQLPSPSSESADNRAYKKRRAPAPPSQPLPPRPPPTDENPYDTSIQPLSTSGNISFRPGSNDTQSPRGAPVSPRGAPVSPRGAPVSPHAPHSSSADPNPQSHRSPRNNSSSLAGGPSPEAPPAEIPPDYDDDQPRRRHVRPTVPRRPMSAAVRGYENEGEDYGKYLNDDSPLPAEPDSTKKKLRKSRSSDVYGSISAKSAQSTLGRGTMKRLKDMVKGKGTSRSVEEKKRRSIYEFSYHDSRIGRVDQSNEALRNSRPDVSHSDSEGASRKWWKVDTLSRSKRSQEVLYGTNNAYLAQTSSRKQRHRERKSRSLPASDTEEAAEFHVKGRPYAKSRSKQQSLGRATINKFRKVLGQKPKDEYKYDDNIYEEIHDYSISDSPRGRHRGANESNIPIPIPPRDYDDHAETNADGIKSFSYVLKGDDVLL